jgi:hypothetical protein
MSQSFASGHFSEFLLSRNDKRMVVFQKVYTKQKNISSQLLALHIH